MRSADTTPNAGNYEARQDQYERNLLARPTTSRDFSGLTLNAVREDEDSGPYDWVNPSTLIQTCIAKELPNAYRADVLRYSLGLVNSHRAAYQRIKWRRYWKLQDWGSRLSPISNHIMTS